MYYKALLIGFPTWLFMTILGYEQGGYDDSSGTDEETGRPGAKSLDSLLLL